MDLEETAQLKRGRLIILCPVCKGALVVPTIDGADVHCGCGMEYVVGMGPGGTVGLLPVAEALERKIAEIEEHGR